MSELDLTTREHLRALLGAHPGLRQLLEELAQRRAERGAWPTARRWRCTDEAERMAAVQLFGTRAVHPVPDDALSFKLDLQRLQQVVAEDHGVELDDWVRGAIVRDTAELPEVSNGVVSGPIFDAASDAIARALAAAPPDPVAQAWLGSERERISQGQGMLQALLGHLGPGELEAEALTVARVVAAVRGNSGPLRLGKFARRVLGLASELRVGSLRYDTVCDALVAFDEDTRAFVADEATTTMESQRTAALARWGIYPDEAAPVVLVYGPLSFEKRGRTLDQILSHARLGEATMLSLEQLQGAGVQFHDYERISCLQRQGAFYDYVERVAAKRGKELVVCADGTTNWAAILLLRVAASVKPGLEVRYAGDLTLGGVLALDRLSRRLGLTLEPWLMDPATLYKYRADGQPLDDRERAALRSAIVDARLPCRDLLAAMEAGGYGVWLDAIADGEF